MEPGADLGVCETPGDRVEHVPLAGREHRQYLFILVFSVFLFFLVFLSIGNMGNIKLGTDEEEPERFLMYMLAQILVQALKLVCHPVEALGQHV